MSGAGQTIDIVGGFLHLAFALGASLICIGSLAMDDGAEKKDPCVRQKLLSLGSAINYVVAVGYFLMYAGLGVAYTRPGDSTMIAWAYPIIWPITWGLLGMALGTYLWHRQRWAVGAAGSLFFAGLVHFAGGYIDTGYALSQWIVFIVGLFFTLGAVYVALCLRNRRDMWSTILLIVGIIGIVGGFYLPYVLSNFILGVISNDVYAVWMLIANFVVYILFFGFLYLTGGQMKQRNC